jgi:hypothetical protein
MYASKTGCELRQIDESNINNNSPALQIPLDIVALVASPFSLHSGIACSLRFPLRPTPLSAATLKIWR